MTAQVLLQLVNSLGINKWLKLLIKYVVYHLEKAAGQVSRNATDTCWKQGTL
jgi:hypothetical protein